MPNDWEEVPLPGFDPLAIHDRGGLGRGGRQGASPVDIIAPAGTLLDDHACHGGTPHPLFSLATWYCPHRSAYVTTWRLAGDSSAPEVGWAGHRHHGPFDTERDVMEYSGLMASAGVRLLRWSLGEDQA